MLDGSRCWRCCLGRNVMQWEWCDCGLLWGSTAQSRPARGEIQPGQLAGSFDGSQGPIPLGKSRETRWVPGYHPKGVLFLWRAMIITTFLASWTNSWHPCCGQHHSQQCIKALVEGQARSTTMFSRIYHPWHESWHVNMYMIHVYNLYIQFTTTFRAGTYLHVYTLIIDARWCQYKKHVNIIGVI